LLENSSASTTHTCRSRQSYLNFVTRALASTSSVRYRITLVWLLFPPLAPPSYSYWTTLVMFAPELLVGDQLPLAGVSSVPTHWLATRPRLSNTLRVMVPPGATCRSRRPWAS